MLKDKALGEEATCWIGNKKASKENSFLLSNLNREKNIQNKTGSVREIWSYSSLSYKCRSNPNKDRTRCKTG